MNSDLPAHMRPERSFQGLILALQRFWADRGCVILQILTAGFIVGFAAVVVYGHVLLLKALFSGSDPGQTS